MVATQRRSGSASCAPSAAGKLQPRPPECGSWNHERWSSRLRMPSCVPSSEKTLDVSPASAPPRRKLTSAVVMPPDRKSVVKGKSVNELVELGGSRNIKKKNKQK